MVVNGVCGSARAALTDRFVPVGGGLRMCGRTNDNEVTMIVGSRVLATMRCIVVTVVIAGLLFTLLGFLAPEFMDRFPGETPAKYEWVVPVGIWLIALLAGVLDLRRKARTDRQRVAEGVRCAKCGYRLSGCVRRSSLADI